MPNARGWTAYGVQECYSSEAAKAGNGWSDRHYERGLILAYLNFVGARNAVGSVSVWFAWP